jgi:hypothetical protein
MRSRRTYRVVAAVFVFAVAVAVVTSACGGDDDVRAGAPGDDQASTTQTTLDPDGVVSSPPISPGDTSPPGDGAQRVQPSKNAAGVNPMAFDPSEAKAVDGAVLVRFSGGVAPCFVLDRFEVDETATEVRVALFAGHERGKEDVACIELAVKYEVKVPLDAPLGTRRLVDANA